MAVYGKFPPPGGGEFGIAFRRHLVEVQTGANKGLTKKAYTCTLFLTKAPKKVIGEGTSVCSFQDAFNPKEGRKQALLRAIQNAGLSEGDEKVVKAAYFSSLTGGRAARRLAMGKRLQKRGQILILKDKGEVEKALENAMTFIDNLLIVMGCRKGEDGRLTYGSAKKKERA